MAYVDQHRGSRQLSSIAGVAAVHALIGYAFVSGLAMNVIHETFPIFKVDSIPDTPVPPPNLPPPPKQKASTPERVTTVRPAFDASASDTTLFVPPNLPELPKQIDDPIVRETPAEPPASKSAGPRVGSGRSGWITADDYPSAAIRAGDEGTVGIQVTIGSDGRVAACTVTAPSGHPALDAATCRLYQRRARFTAALDAAGTPVSASYSDRVRWVLPPQ